MFRWESNQTNQKAVADRQLMQISRKQAVLEAGLLAERPLGRLSTVSAGESAGSLITYEKEFSFFHELEDIFIIKTNEERVILQPSL